MKRTVALLLVASLAVAAPISTKVNAATSDQKDAYKAYYSLIKDLHKSTEWSGGYNKYKLIYVDNDDVPELLAVDTPADVYDNNGTYQYVVYTYYNGKAKKLSEFSSGVASAGGYRGDTYYIKKSGKIYETSISAGSGEGTDIVYKMNKGKLKKKAKGDYSLATETQKWNDKSVSAEEYNEKLNKAFNTKKAVSFEKIKTISYSKMREKLK